MTYQTISMHYICLRFIRIKSKELLLLFSNSLRGALNCIYDPFYNTGVIISYLLGDILSCIDQAKIQLIPPALFFIVLFFVPESPEYWKKRNKLEVKCSI